MMHHFNFHDGKELEIEAIDAFNEHGFIILRNVFSEKEVKKLIAFFESSEEIQKAAHGVSDGAGLKSKLALWNHPGDDVSGTVPRMDKVVGNLERLLGGHELYHYHTKLMMKEAEVGGRFMWHQDYGYWYKNGCLYPDMGSVFIALDRCTQSNSCLKVLDGSHKMGRIDHILVGNNEDGEKKQNAADPQRVAMIEKVCPLVYCELEPGDAIFFHCNLLHTSDQNRSGWRRWAMICSFNQARNNPVLEHHHPQYTKLDRLQNDALLECNNCISSTDKWFLNPNHDISTSKKRVET